MSKNSERSEYRFTLFKPGTPRNVKVRSIVFFAILTIFIFLQAFYWIFANSAEPYVLGMPFGMFFIVLFIALEFVFLVILYLLENKNEKEGGEA